MLGNSLPDTQLEQFLIQWQYSYKNVAQMFGILAVQRRKIQEALQITIKPVYGVRTIQFNEGGFFIYAKFWIVKFWRQIINLSDEINGLFCELLQ